MIEYLNVEITPTRFAETKVKELRIRIKSNRKGVFEKRKLCYPDELVSFFDQIWDCAKSEVLKALK